MLLGGPHLEVVKGSKLMAIAQENIERIQRMEGAIWMTMPSLWRNQKSSGTAKERGHQESIQSNSVIIIVVRFILMIWTCPIKLTFQQIYLVVSCLSEDAVYDLLDEHFQMGVELWRSQRKWSKNGELLFIFYLFLGDEDASELLRSSIANYWALVLWNS